MIHLGEDPRQELTCFLRQFQIGIIDCNDQYNRTHPSFLLPNGQHKDVLYYKVLLEAIKLLPTKTYEAGAFTSLRLWGESDLIYFPNAMGTFNPRTRRICLTEKSLERTLLGLAYTLFHEIGHTLELQFPDLPERPLPPEYYEHRDICTIPTPMHDLATGDLLIYFALATEQDIDEWYSSLVHSPKESGKIHSPLNDRNIKAIDAFRREKVGPPREGLDQIRAFVDLIKEAEELRGLINNPYNSWGQESTANYRKTLQNLRQKSTP